MSFSSHFLVRGLPTLLLFQQSAVQQPSVRWPRSLPQLTQHIAHATGQQPHKLLDDQAAEAEEAVLEEREGGARRSEAELEAEEEEDEWFGDDELSELDELLGVTSELEYGLVFGVLGMSVVHWLHRLKDKLDRWEVEVMALQHAGI